MHDCQALSSGKLSSQQLIVTNLLDKAFSHLPSFNLRPCQKKSHLVYALENAYLGRTPTTPLKNAIEVRRLVAQVLDCKAL